MAFDAFVHIEGIEGESSDMLHKGWIEILNFGIGVKQNASSTASSSGGASVERVNFKDFTFTRPMDRASPKLAFASAVGTHIDEIIVELCRAGGEKLNFMTYRLRNCIISRIFTIGGGHFPMESVHINFGKIDWVYTQQNRLGGGAMGQVATGWNLEKNCQL